MQIVSVLWAVSSGVANEIELLLSIVSAVEKEPRSFMQRTTHKRLARFREGGAGRARVWVNLLISKRWGGGWLSPSTGNISLSGDRIMRTKHIAVRT